MSINQTRIDLAIEQIGSGKPFMIGDLTLSLSNESTVSVRFPSNWSIENMNKRTALHELQEAKDILSEIRFSSKAFNDYLSKKMITYILVYDYGMGGINICREENGEVTFCYDISD